ASRSCVTSVESVQDEEIKTIEGLLTNNDLNTVQKAWIAEGVPQCGYCQSGQIMTATALLSQRPDPNDEDINNAMKNNICRCGTYSRVRKAIHRAAKELNSG
ncbi:MAG: 2Fe-2S iron-sulfur cluster-binding protein, partial [Candidatus Marinimicrobia bacterium]|nr:2Fe-2S iron-sulfur cluster-binding protein [Candidatus Neomarinimicrobiota bacterium]